MSTNPTEMSLYTALFISRCQQTFQLLPRQWQVEVGSVLIQSHFTNVSIKHLCVRPTGGGKSLVFNTVADVLLGVTICICPLLSLGADQAKKLLSKSHANQKAITAFHLDELSNSAIGKLKRFLETPAYLNCPTSIILFASPQAITTRYYPFVNWLINRNIIRFVVVDEIHLAVHFGNSFRDEFLKLKDLFFNKLKSTVPMAFMTATCSRFIESSIQDMFGIELNRSHWPSPIEMMHRSVSIYVSYTSRPFQYVSKTIKSNIAIHPSLANKVIVYSNRRVRIFNFAEKLEKLLDMDDDFKKIDVLTLVGTLTKEEKAEYIRLFVNGSSRPNCSLDMRVLCATSGVGNAGIDSPDVRCVYRIDFPPSVHDFVQEKGRAGRRINASPSDYSYHVCISIESLLFLFKRILNPAEEVNNDNYRSRQVEDLLQMAQLITAQTKCYAIAFETILGNPSSPEEYIPICGSCPACRNDMLFPKIHREGATDVVFDLFCCSTVRYKTLQATIDYIRKYPNVAFKIFRKKVKKIDPALIKKFLFVMVAARILDVVFDSEIEKGGDVVFTLKRVDGNHLKMALMIDSYWDNIRLIL